eukprot:GHVU01113200.1.p2 GENE.GHVU01113200.1~~GHVU01113200.1.p2  ORF type:complete len:176 (-),score=14.49 GHVU01113200.1:13-540(-)
MYGYKFLFETYLYHVTRTDTRHNMSPYFYFLYIHAQSPPKAVGLITTIPQWLAAIVLGLRAARFSLPAALFLQTLVFVSLNKVITAQYFIWWLALLPTALCATPMTRKSLLQLCAGSCCWVAALAAWLWSGYKVEFRGLSSYRSVSGSVWMSVCVWMCVWVCVGGCVAVWVCGSG